MIFKEWVSTDLIEELVLGMDDRSPVPHINHLKPGGQLPHHADCIPEISIYTSELLASENNRGLQQSAYTDSSWVLNIKLMFKCKGMVSHCVPENHHLHISTVSLREQHRIAAIYLQILTES